MTAYIDRVKETSTSTGTGNITLAGASTGYQSFNTAFGTSISFCYVIEAIDGTGAPTGDWEVGQGFLSDATTLNRDIVFVSSNANAAVNLSAGTKNVFCTFPAQSAQMSQLSFNQQYGLP